MSFYVTTLFNISISQSTKSAIGTTAAPTTEAYSIINRETFRIMKCFVNPSFAMVGLILNILSALIFVKSGIKKPTNVFLLAFSVSDIMSHGSTLNFANILRYFDPWRPFPSLEVWQFKYELCYFFYICERLWTFCGNWGYYVQTFVPVVITLDRLLAVFLPLTFRRFITFKVSCFICLGIYLFWLPWLLSTEAFTAFYFIPYKNYGFGLIGLSLDMHINYDLFNTFNLVVFQVLSSWVPVVLVSAGCLAIALKLKWALRKRRLMTSSYDIKQMSPKTSRALLSVCLTFAFFTVLNNVLQYCLMKDITLQSSIRIYLTEIFFFIASIHRISNFFVYIIFNEKFKKCLRQIVKK